MADKDLAQGEALAPTDKTKYVQLGSGSIYARAVAPAGENGAYKQDPLGAQVAILATHYEIHEGDTYIVSYKSPEGADVADNGTVLFIITTHNTYAHIVFRAAAGGDMEGEFYEDTQVEPGTGTAMTAYNKSRPNPKTATVGVRRGMTLGPVGTLLEHTLVAGGSGPFSVGGAASSRSEWILSPSHVYMVRITNRSGGAVPMSLAVEWYETQTTG